MKILCFGDVVGEHAVATLKKRLPQIKRELAPDLVIINGENASMGRGNGMSAEDAKTLLYAGADVLTGGNHSFRQRSLYPLLDSSDVILRPANYPSANPGKGYTVISANGRNVLVVNLVGRVDMDPAACPFETVDRILASERENYDLAVVDFHAEATGEKIAMGYHLDGRVQCLFGTHTHVPTGDERILPHGTGFITDIGMCGPTDSALGLRPDCILTRMKTGMPVRFEPADGQIELCGILFTLSDFDYHCKKIERMKFFEQ